MPLRQRQIALFLLFFAPGLSLSSWITRTPTIRDQIGASTAEMGLVLLSLSAGAMIGILSSGPLVLRFGGRRVITAGMSGLVASMPLIGLGVLTTSQALVALGLGLFGLGMGTGEVAMNIEGAEVERLTGRPFLPQMHGSFSLGTLVGALLGILFTLLDFSVTMHLVLVGLVALAAVWWSLGKLPAETGRRRASATADAQGQVGAPSAKRVWTDTRLLLIGAIVLAMALAEGTASDWLPLVMVDGHGMDEALGSVVYALFAASMTIGRFCGGPVIRAFGRAWVLAGSALFAALGIVLISVVDNPIVAAASVVLWGLGASLGFPVALSAAGDSGPDPAARVALASTVGYMAFLVGPPALGFIGEEFGLRAALVVPAAVVLAASLLAPAAGARSSAKL